MQGNERELVESFITLPTASAKLIYPWRVATRGGSYRGVWWRLLLVPCCSSEEQHNPRHRLTRDLPMCAEFQANALVTAVAPTDDRNIGLTILANGSCSVRRAVFIFNPFTLGCCVRQSSLELENAPMPRRGDQGRINARGLKGGGSQICKHDRRRSECKERLGSSICPRKRRKSTCKECGGSQICQHDRPRRNARAPAQQGHTTMITGRPQSHE